jgi:hypothetical protein
LLAPRPRGDQHYAARQQWLELNITSLRQR